MVNVLGYSAPSYAMVNKLMSLFKRGRKHINDDLRSWRPRTATTPIIIDS